MNNIKIKDGLQRMWLKVNSIGTPRDGQVTLRGEMFDGTHFDFVVPDHSYENQGGDCPALVEVGLVGTVCGDVREIVLPAPVLTQGYTVRVRESSLLKWDFYNKIKEMKK